MASRTAGAHGWSWEAITSMPGERKGFFSDGDVGSVGSMLCLDIMSTYVVPKSKHKEYGDGLWSIRTPGWIEPQFPSIVWIGGHERTKRCYVKGNDPDTPGARLISALSFHKLASGACHLSMTVRVKRSNLQSSTIKWYSETLKIKFKFSELNFCHKKSTINPDNMSPIHFQNFRGFG